MNPLTDDDRKVLTEFLGECWHKKLHDAKCMYDSCENCGNPWHKINIKFRTFTVWQDLGDLKEKLVEKGMWLAFMCFAARQYNKDHQDRPLSLDGSYVVVDFNLWLLSPARFCQLVADWWKEEHHGQK